MKGRLKNVALLVFVVVFMPIAWVAIHSGPDVNSEELVEKRLADLRDRLHYAQMLNRERENDIQSLRNQLKFLVGIHSHGNVTHQGGVVFGREAREYLANFSAVGLTHQDLHLPGLFQYMPHLVGKPHGLRPAFKLSQGRRGVSVVIGIPTIKRERDNYLAQTLASLLESLNEEEKEDTLLVVFVAEPNDPDYVKVMATRIQSLFKKALASGLLEVIAPPAAFYPNMNSLKETFGDSKDRVKWRTKQNLDFSFLMLYARSRGTYYVQLEDDVVTKPGYLSIMKNFALNQKTDDWLLLEFSHLGFIGKLFKSSDLPMVVEFFLMFHKDKPIDWLLDHLLANKVCSPEKDNKHCQRMIAEVRRRFRPSLFQHIGTYSSLKGKVQRLKDRDFGKDVVPIDLARWEDRDFGKAPLHRAHINPNAEVSTTLKVYQRYNLDRAYMGETFFWGLIPRPGDVITFKFSPPIKIERYLLKSGNTEHPGDKFYNTTVEILPQSHTHKQSGILDNKAHVEAFPKTDDKFLIISHFDENGIAQGSIDPSIGEINTFRLRVLTESKTWVILSEIFIKPFKTR